VCAQYSEDQSSFGIKSWSEEDRPREKLLQKGYHALSDAELVAILLGSGTRRESAVDVARRLLDSAGNNLDSLGRFALKKLSEPKGIGQAKAITIAAALELGRRRKKSSAQKATQITSSQDVYDYIYPHLADLDHEQFYLILLNRKHTIMSAVNISKGGVSGTVVDPKMVFKAAVDNLCSSLIVCHNHPSGNKKPSDEDKRLTRKLQDGGECLDIKVLDHLIVTDNDYLSFADEGLM
jgi:DNA repair protein RadC